MVRYSALLFAVLALSECSSGTGGPKTSAEHVYLLFEPSNEQRGWEAISAMRSELLKSARNHPRAAGLIRSGDRTMYVDVDGDCRRDAGSFAALRPVAGRAGARELTCSAELPGAL